MAVTWRKTRDGSWAVFGPASEVHTGSVTVKKKSGGASIAHVERLSRSFPVDGRQYVFGFVEDERRRGSGGDWDRYGRDRNGVGWSGRGMDPRHHDPGCTGPDSGCAVCFDD